MISNNLVLVERGFHDGRTSKSWIYYLQVLRMSCGASYLAHVKYLNAVSNCFRTDDSVSALVVADLSPKAGDTVLRKAAYVVQTSFRFAEKWNVIPPAFAYDFGKSGPISLSDGDEFSTIDGISPDGTP